MTLLKHLWAGEEEVPEVKTAYHYVLDLGERIEKTCQHCTRRNCCGAEEKSDLLQQESKGKKTE